MALAIPSAALIATLVASSLLQEAVSALVRLAVARRKKCDGPVCVVREFHPDGRVVSYTMSPEGFGSWRSERDRRSP